MSPRKPVILCVDDEEANLRLLEKLLIPKGYAIVRASSGKDALRMIKSRTIDLVLLDIVMPGMDGFEVCRQIKEDKKSRDIPVILITVLTAKQDRIRGIKVGAEEFLSKPFDLTEVLARIKILLKVKELNDERQRAESQRETALEALQKSHDELDGMVRERTAELIKTNEILQAEITERKRAEAALMENEERFRSLYENSTIGLYRTTPAGEVLMANPALVKMLGYSSFAELASRRLADDCFETAYPRSRFLEQFAEHDEVIGFEAVWKRRDGSTIFVREGSHAIRDAQGVILYFDGTVEDISERKRAEEKLKNSLAEKEVLLKEVHHRVKNNLMTVIGLIKMQGTKANIELFNPLLLELEGRVRSMALVHESLHKSANLVRVNLQNYIETMSSHIRAQFGTERDIHFLVQAAGVDVGLDIAVPCGLVLNELIVNAFKHAFPADKPGSGEDSCEISVAVVRDGGNFKLTVADNGVGLPAGVNWKNPGTLGLQLVKMLSQQIDASLEMERSSGTVFILRFRVPEQIY